MPLGTFVPGVYTATWNSLSLGMVEGGFNIRYRDKEKAITNTSTYADTKIDGIYRGRDVFIDFVLKEWSANIRKLMMPYQSQSGNTDFGKLGQIGQLASGVAQAFVLTAEANSPAAANSGGTWTFHLSKLAPENDVRFLLGPDERDIPILMDVLPYSDSGTIRHWTFATS